eukprot:TRINITY_DN39181_c0_g1_i1.p1 TRINITY_DN39181_c0_g1~~TRINITY_DN39181_c0_g1_i1.p1  ORF type:complete len:466 (+),score=108.03 TRINITY_DN39181_c0_g1_i1:66-1463(+)
MLTSARRAAIPAACRSSCRRQALWKSDGASPSRVRLSSMSGQEVHCLELVGHAPGTFVWGNSVRALGVPGAMLSAVRARAGGSNTQITKLINSGREAAYNQMLDEARASGDAGVVGVQISLNRMSGLVEFTGHGSTVRPTREEDRTDGECFATICTGEQFFCLRDCGLSPKGVAFGNEAYSRGLVGAVASAFRTYVSGEIKEYSAVFNKARATALARLRENAFKQGCSVVTGVQMRAVRMLFVQEVSFVGTACTHPGIRQPVTADDVITSSLPEEELWSIVKCGRTPISVVMGCSVHNLGVGRAFTGAVQRLTGGEISRFTELGNSARAKAVAQVQQQAEALGADEVVGMHIHVEEVTPGCIEFFAHGTAVKYDTRMTTKSRELPPQVLVGKRQPFLNHSALSPMAASTKPDGAITKRQEELQSRYGGFFVSVAAVLKMFGSALLRVLTTIVPFLGRFIRPKKKA